MQIRMVVFDLKICIDNFSFQMFGSVNYFDSSHQPGQVFTCEPETIFRRKELKTVELVDLDYVIIGHGVGNL